MPHDARAYLADIIESCDAIEKAIAPMDLSSYQRNRLVRSATVAGWTTTSASRPGIGTTPDCLGL